MKSTRRAGLLLLAGLAIGIMSGCQGFVTEAGITAPSPYYLRHAPQYFPPSEPYPLPKELRSLEDASRRASEEMR